MKLGEYKRKRDFQKTPEPKGAVGEKTSQLYLIQKHAATRLHYDFRLAWGGVLKSWAVPKGPSLNPNDKRLAVHVEDHPLDYGSFEGIIPQGEYGGGTVMMWDRGEWTPDGDPQKAYEKGHLKFEVKGQRLSGRWALIRMGARASGDEKNWLLVKEKDAATDAQTPITERYDTSVITRRTMEEIAAQARPKKKTDASGKKPIPAASTLLLTRKSPFPTSLKPQLATLADGVPTGSQWIHEVKYDGYRLLAFVEKGRVRLFTRNELDWTRRFPSIQAAIEKLPMKNGILDGEVVVQREDGTSDFQALQNALKTGEKARLIYYVFDLPYVDGHDLSQTPLIERKKMLQEQLGTAALNPGGTIRYSAHIEGQGAAVFKNACHYALEGIVSKHVDSAYHQGRTRDWLKVKCANRQEFVIGGYTAPKGGRSHFGSLVLGYYNRAGELVYVGHVGTGFSDALLASLIDRLNRLRQKNSPFHRSIEDKLRRAVVWVKPELVAEVQFAGWTNEGILRQATFEGLREDKKASEVMLERPAAKMDSPPPAPADKQPKDSVAGVALTHPDKILYPDQGVTKRDVCLYYEKVSSWMLPHIKGRPLSLVRCPQGEGKACFYQKHFTETVPMSIRGIPIKEKSKEDVYILIDDVQGLVSLTQMGVLEFHPWPSTESDIEHPDRLVFDLDPAPGVHMVDLAQAARLVRDTLADRGLTSFLKTTGGKGLHVVVPVQPNLPWDDFKAFSAAVANDIVKEHPNDYVATMSKAKRTGKIFIDFFRNGRGATSVAPYSSRARAGATVSMPLSWDQLNAHLRPEKFTVKNVPVILSKEGDPWRGFFKIKQTLSTGEEPKTRSPRN